MTQSTAEGHRANFVRCLNLSSLPGHTVKAMLFHFDAAVEAAQRESVEELARVSAAVAELLAKTQKAIR